MQKPDTSPLLPDHSYHVFARTNNRERLFVTDENYRFFLQRCGELLCPVSKIHAYCLLENHVHLLIQMREEAFLQDFCERLNVEREALALSNGSNTFLKSVTSSTVGSYQFQRLFTSYAKSFNKQQGRYGNLIQRPFKRKPVADENHWFQTIYYIHNNACKHGFVADFRKWKWSSYHAFLSAAPTKVERDEVLGWFGGLPNFLAYHEQFLENQDWEF